MVGPVVLVDEQQAQLARGAPAQHAGGGHAAPGVLPLAGGAAGVDPDGERRVTGRDQQPGDAVDDVIGHAAGLRGDDRLAGGKRFQGDSCAG